MHPSLKGTLHDHYYNLMIQLKYFPDSMCSELKKGLKELFKIIKKVTMSVLILWEDMEKWFDTK